MPLPNFDLLFQQAWLPATETGTGIMTAGEALSQNLLWRKGGGLIPSLIPGMNFSSEDKCPGRDCHNWLILLHKTHILWLLTG